jgi:hypothetical protein
LNGLMMAVTSFMYSPQLKNNELQTPHSAALLPRNIGGQLCKAGGVPSPKTGRALRFVHQTTLRYVTITV